MPSKPEETKAQLIDKIVGALGDRLSGPATAMAQAFARQYYAWVATEDLLESDPEDLYGAALSHWNLAHQRLPGTASVRVYNPNFEQHGWQSTHTVIEIVTDDMPFLVDSVTMALNRHGLTVHRIIHPVIRVERDGQNLLTAVMSEESRDGRAESIMHFEVDRQTNLELLAALQDDIARVLQDVRSAVEDWPEMRTRMVEVMASLDAENLPLAADEVQEIKAFLAWAADNHYTFLGYRAYDLAEEHGEVMLRTVAGSGLGILRGDHPAGISQSFAELPLALRRLSLAPTALIISKANARATVHRPAHLDYLGVKRFDHSGAVIGEWRFLGLYTALAYSMLPKDIPLLRRKVNRVLMRSRLHPKGHDYKVLQHILDTFPRDDLFQATEDELYEISMGILNLRERQRLRLFLRRDAFDRFVSCMVYVPRERYNTEMRLRMQDILMKACNGQSSTFVTQFSESVLARVLFHIRTIPGQVPDYVPAEVELQLREAMLSWKDGLQRVLLEQCGEERGNEFFLRYAEAFPAAYAEDFTTRTAVSDILHLEQLDPAHPLVTGRLY